MSHTVNRQWVLAARPEGPVKRSDFLLIETPLRLLAEGEFRIQILFLSVAAVMRNYMLNTEKFERPLALGDLMHGRGVGRIVESRNTQWRVGEIVHGKMGWQDYAIADGSAYYLMFKVKQRVVPISTALGVLGLTGFTAYLGLVDIGGVKAGDRVLVSGAGGGVGSNVGQISRNLGAEAIGIAGSEEKCTLLINRLGYSGAINYRTESISSRIAALCPEGIDVFFDNVGGETLDAGLEHLRRHGRVVLCGAISQYINGVEQPYALRNAFSIFKKMARMEAFFIYEMSAHFERAEAQMSDWIATGQLVYQEDILEGLELMPEALIRLFAGQNIGKQLVRIIPNS
ncbi:MAG: NADP-dependent oxidoreductase [Gammaproteobacteria bacterium]|nr:NADP-dependent oxidoreductase [Gammaproteobacteria bacterium]